MVATRPGSAGGTGTVRIAIVGPTHPYKGGVAQHTTELAHRLAAAGDAVTLESWSAQYPALLYPGQQRVDTPELPLFPRTSYPLSWRRPDGWLRLGRRLGRTTDAVVLVLVTPVQAPALATIERAIGAASRRLVLCHNVLPHERRRIDERLVRMVLDPADAVLVHARSEREQAQLLTAAPVSVAPLPPHCFAPGDPAPADRPVRRVLLFFGMVRPYKGLDVLLRALAQGPPDVRLVVAGEFWGGAEATEKLVAELGIAARVDLRPGYVPAADVPGLLAGADALVLPYRDSTASRNGSLGHEHGLPVVATRVGTMGEQVRDEVDGLLCEPGDVGGLAAAIRRLYEPGVLQRLRSGVRPTDADGQWDTYVEAVRVALGAGVPGDRSL
jgi:D-inositol-3-phosphate glycosyltransferase